jgi:hypothetical protein
VDSFIALKMLKNFFGFSTDADQGQSGVMPQPSKTDADGVRGAAGK